MQRVNKKPADHFEGKWRKDRKYTLFAVVENNGTLFRSLTAKPKQEPYVIYNAENETFVANDGWELVRLSKDSEISSGGNLTLEDLATALEKVVSVESQSLTDEQKAQVIENIGALGSIEEYTIAQALNDLNERIEGLQEQAAVNNDIPKPIILTDFPALDDTVQSLAEKGLTYQEVLAASQGKRTGVLVPENSIIKYHQITLAYVYDGGYMLAFDRIIRVDGLVVDGGASYYVSVVGGDVDQIFIGEM